MIVATTSASAVVFTSVASDGGAAVWTGVGGAGGIVGVIIVAP
jgi:hypothetical protein